LDNVAPDGNLCFLAQLHHSSTLDISDMIEGAVIYVDHFNNAITNSGTTISNLKGRNFEIIFGQNKIIFVKHTRKYLKAKSCACSTARIY
jgi:exosome complex RNA-binding protein Rrp4